MKKIHLENKIKIDIIITSPPYNINKEYRKYQDKKEKDEYLTWLQQIAKISLKILQEDGSFFLNISGRPSDPWLPLEVAQGFGFVGFKLQNVIHWIKSISIEKKDIGGNNSIKQNSSIGHFKPISSNRFLSDLHEYVFHFTKDGKKKVDKFEIGVEYQDKTNIKRWKSGQKDRRDRGNVWLIPYKTIKEKRPHPAVFPEKLPYLCIKFNGYDKKSIVFDPFMGIGTTALACLSLGVKYIGTEIDEKYIEIANEYITKKKKEIL